MAEHPWLPAPALHGDDAQFALAASIVTLAVLVLAAVSIGFQPAWSAGALVGVAYALAINALSHLLIILLSWSLMPGTITGVLLLLPLGLVTARSLPPVRWTPAAVVAIALAAAGIVVGSLVLAAGLTALG